MSTILVDIDGVLADFVYGYSIIANDMYGTPLLRTEACSTRSVEEALGLTKVRGLHVWNAIKASDKFWIQLPGLATQEEFKRISALAGVVFCTARPAWARWQTREWLSERGLWQPCLHVTRKAPLLGAFGDGGYAIDDHELTIREMVTYCIATKSTTWKPSLMGRRFNGGCRDLPRVDSLKEFLDACQ